MLLFLCLVAAMALTNLYSASHSGGDTGASPLFFKQLIFCPVCLHIV